MNGNCTAAAAGAQERAPGVQAVAEAIVVEQSPQVAEVAKTSITQHTSRIDVIN